MSSCKVDKNQSNEAERLLESGIEGVGGWDAWTALDTIKFFKTTKLYLEDGGLEDSTYQFHTYIMYPQMKGQYQWLEGDLEYLVKYEDGKVTKTKNGENQKLSNEEEEKLRLGFLGAQFVMCLPFKLKDPGVTLEVNKESEIGGKKARVLKASYDTKNANHTKSHDWWHYFDPHTYEYLGYKVYHAPTHAKVQNVKTTQINGVTFPTYRKTYRVDDNDKELFLRAEFWYLYEE